MNSSKSVLLIATPENSTTVALAAGRLIHHAGILLILFILSNMYSRARSRHPAFTRKGTRVMRTAATPILLLLLLLLPFHATATAQEPVTGDRAIRRSDVVFMYDNPDRYEEYGCTVLGWAGRADKSHIGRAHAKGVRLFSTSVGFLTEFRTVIDFSDNFLDAAARDFAGEPFIVPWLWDHKYQQQPAWWWCTNSPLYRDYLGSRLEQSMKAQPDGLHIDDYRGSSGSVTWLSGCFCRHCMAAFRKYVAANISQEQLNTLGIADPDTFDYRQFLLERGVKPEEYNRRRASLPLANEFYDFQVHANTDFVAAYHKQALELRGAPLTLCVNSGLTNPQALAIAPHLSYFCCEVHHGAPTLEPARHPIYIYKLADGLNRPVTSTASGQDWAYVYEHGNTCLVRSWAALSYAFGHTLMAPHRQWCYNKEKGTHWYDGPTEEYAWLYRFVRDHASLLDGYEAIAPVAVLYDNSARRKNASDVEPICVALAEANIPFTVLVAGDNWLDYQIDVAKLKPFKQVIACQTVSLDTEQTESLETVRREGRLVTWKDASTLSQLDRPVQVEGSEHVMVVPRSRPGRSDSAIVIHLLNRKYDGQHDRLIPQGPFTVRLGHDLVGDITTSKATLHVPNAEPLALRLRNEGHDICLEVPSLGLWGIIAIEP